MTGSKPTGATRAKRKRRFDTVDVMFWILRSAGALAVLWVLGQFAVAGGVVDRSTVDEVVRWFVRIVVAVAVVMVVAGIVVPLVLRRRSNRAKVVDRLNRTLAPVFKYPVGTTHVEVHRWARGRPVEWTVHYPATTDDDDPGWAPKMVAAIARRTDVPVELVSIDRGMDAIRVRRADGETAVVETGVMSPDTAVDPTPGRQQEVLTRIADGAVAALGVKEKERRLVRVVVEEWDPAGRVPLRFTIRYPSGVATQNWDLRSNLFEKVGDLYPTIRWGVVWDTAEDTVTFTDLGPDPLADPVGLDSIPDAVDDPVALLAAVPLGRREDGRPWTIRLRGRHILIAGESGSGKGSVLWNIIRGLLPAIRSGHVVVVALDPKGGMELIRPGRGARRDGGLFHRVAATNRDIATEMAGGAREMKARALRLNARMHTPTVADPHVVFIVDELMNPTVIEPDKKVVAEFEAGMVDLLSAGRAVGFTVIAATQKPDKDTTRYRDLFTLRICLRVSEKTKVPMVLRDDSRARGARADKIPPTGMEGTAYVIVDDPGAADNNDVIRVRAAWVPDEEIDRMVEWLRSRAAADAEAAAAAAPIPVEDLVESDRVLADLGNGLEPVTVQAASEESAGRFSVDVVTAAGQPWVIEVDPGEVFERV